MVAQIAKFTATAQAAMMVRTRIAVPASLSENTFRLAGGAGGGGGSGRSAVTRTSSPRVRAAQADRLLAFDELHRGLYRTLEYYKDELARATRTTG